MNTSTDGVEIVSGFVFDVLAEYKSVRKLCGPAFELAAGLDPLRLDKWCSIELHNGVCQWIEDNVGSNSIRRAGNAIGGRVYEGIVAQNASAALDPLAMMQALAGMATQLIRDPHRRGYDVREDGPRGILIRRTQTFNCILQEGLILALIEKTRVLMPSVRQVRCTRNGDELCDYEVRWLRDRNVA